MRDEDDMHKHIKRRRKRKRDKMDTNEQQHTQKQQDEQGGESNEWVATDLLAPLHILHTKAKTRWVAPVVDAGTMTYHQQQQQQQQQGGKGVRKKKKGVLCELVIAKATNMLEVCGVWCVVYCGC